MKLHSKQQRKSSLGHARGGTNSNNACAVSYEMKCKHTMPLVLLDQSTIEIIEIIEIIPRSENKGKHFASIVARRTLQKITHSHHSGSCRTNSEPRNECQIISSSRHRVTHKNDNTGYHHAREMSSTANETRDYIASTANQDIGEYNYMLSTLA